MTLRPFARSPIVAPIATLLAALMLAPAAQAAKFTYHGDLMDGGAPANGTYDLRVRAFAQPGDAKALSEAIELPGVLLADGRFSTELDLPEDADGITWVEVAVRKSGSGADYETLGDPQPLAKANSTCPGAWALDGNSGAPAGSFLGFVDNTQPLVLKANNNTVATFTPRGTVSNYGDAPGVVLGSSANVASGIGATVGGGGSTRAASGAVCSICNNNASGEFSTVSGGTGNTASGGSSTVGGGKLNTASNSTSTVSGGMNNMASAANSTVGGGYGNTAASNDSTVSGGNTNTASGGFSTVSGGTFNRALANSSTVSGGYTNIANSDYSTVIGGYGNTAGGADSTVGGGRSNCAGGAASWAGGTGAKIRPGTGLGSPGYGCFDVANSGDADGDEGTFVWADNTAPLTSTGPNQFLIRADGGVGINTSKFGAAVNLRGSELMIKNNGYDGNTDVTLLNSTNRGYLMASIPGTGGAAGDFYVTETDARTATVGFTNRLRIDAAGTTFVVGGAVGNLSDARLKKNVAEIAAPLDTLLALHGQVFEYIDPVASMNPPGQRMGFIAQDVQKAIPQWVKPTGPDGYLAVTPIGFEALAVEAIRDLKAESDVRIEQLEAENAALRSDNAAMRASLETLDARLAKLETRQGK